MKRSYQILHLSRGRGQKDLSLKAMHALWTQTTSPSDRVVAMIAGKEIPGLKYVLVAEVVAESLEQAFAKTQSARGSWGNHPGVRLLLKAVPRSTSVGDLIVDADGVTHMVTLDGFEKIERPKT